MAPRNDVTASSNENKKKRSASNSDEAQEVLQGDSKKSCQTSSPFPIDSGFGSLIDNPIIIEEGVNDFVDKRWPEFEPMFRQQVFKDINTLSRSLFSPLTKEDGAIHNNISFFQGISQNAMEIVGDFFEDFRQMGHTFLKKEGSKEHKSTPRTIGEDEDYDIGGATPSFVGEGEDNNLGGAEEEA